MVVTGHDDDGLLAAREVPETRQRRLVPGHVDDQVGEQTLLLVRLRDGDLVQIDPVRLRIAGRISVVLVVRTLGGEAVAFLIRPRRVALAGVDDRGRQVIGEGRRLSAVRADVAERHRRIGRGGCRIRIEGRHRRGPVEGVAIGGTVKLHGLPDDTVAGGRRRYRPRYSPPRASARSR